MVVARGYCSPGSFVTSHNEQPLHRLAKGTRALLVVLIGGRHVMIVLAYLTDLGNLAN